MLQQQPTPYFSQQPGSMMPVLLPSQQLPNSPPQVVYMTQEQAMQQQMQMQQHTQHVPLQQQQQAQQYQLQQQLSMRPNQQQQAPHLQQPPPVALPLVLAYQQVQPGDVQVELPAGEAASSGGANGSGGFNGKGGPAHGKASDVETPPPAGHGRLAGCCAQQRAACCPEGRKFGWPEFVAGLSGCGVAALGCVQYCWGNLAEPLLVESVSPRCVNAAGHTGHALVSKTPPPLARVRASACRVPSFSCPLTKTTSSGLRALPFAPHVCVCMC